MDVKQLTDVELRKSLENLGVNCGPVTNTTRTVYEKRLVKLQSQSRSEPEIVQSREEIVVESTTEKKVTRGTRRINKTIEVEEVDSPMVYRDSFSSPRTYTPDGSNLTRRPLNTPHRSATKVTTITTTSKVESSQGKNKSSFGFCKILLPVLIVLAILVLLVYYHMDKAPKQLTKD